MAALLRTAGNGGGWKRKAWTHTHIAHAFGLMRFRHTSLRSICVLVSHGMPHTSHNRLGDKNIGRRAPCSQHSKKKSVLDVLAFAGWFTSLPRSGHVLTLLPGSCEWSGIREYRTYVATCYSGCRKEHIPAALARAQLAASIFSSVCTRSMAVVAAQHHHQQQQTIHKYFNVNGSSVISSIIKTLFSKLIKWCFCVVWYPSGIHCEHWLSFFRPPTSSYFIQCRPHPTNGSRFEY